MHMGESLSHSAGKGAVCPTISKLAFGEFVVVS